jgi:hypothetical protein
LIHSSISEIIVQQEIVYDELARHNQIQNVKYQNIKYFMNTINGYVNNTPIDFLKAMDEMQNLDHNFDDNFIGFVNERTQECLQFIHKTKDDWYAEVVIGYGKKWEGYCWCADSKTQKITDMIRLFFEEVPWFGMIQWKMRRFKH